MMMEGSEECSLKQIVVDLLKEKKFESILTSLQSTGNEAQVKDNCLDLITAVCSVLKSSDFIKNSPDISVCEDIVSLLVSKGNAKEVLVILLEQADTFKDDEFFCFLLNPFKCVLQKIPRKRGKSLQWVLCTLNAHLESLPLPQDLDLQGEEKLLLDNDPAVQRVSYVLDNYLSFIEVFVDEVSFNVVFDKEFMLEHKIANQREILQKYILKLFNHPFLYQDLNVRDSKLPKSEIQHLCEKAIEILSKICKNFFDLYKLISATPVKEASNDLQAEDDDEVSKLALSNLIYLLFAEHFVSINYPLVYSNEHTFIKNLEFTLELLSKKENLVIFKGLSLSKALLKKLADFELCHSCLEFEFITSFPKVLLNIAIYCQVEEYRNLAVKLFLSYINKFDWEGRYLHIMHIISTVEHSGSQGLVINLYKDYLHTNLTENLSPNVFLGRNMKVFLLKILVLRDGAETDILDNCDKIITTLNLFRYLLLRDKKEINMTGIWNIIDKIEEKFLTPLHTGLDLSRAHYNLKLKEVKECSKQNVKGIASNVSVNGESLSNIPPNVQTGILNRGLVTFDMIESVLARIREILQVS